MSHEVVKVIYSRDKLCRVDIFRRANGTFGFEDWRYWTEEDSWAPKGGYSDATMESVEAAIKEAIGRISWLEKETEG